MGGAAYAGGAEYASGAEYVYGAGYPCCAAYAAWAAAQFGVCTGGGALETALAGSTANGSPS